MTKCDTVGFSTLQCHHHYIHNYNLQVLLLVIDELQFETKERNRGKLLASAWWSLVPQWILIQRMLAQTGSLIMDWLKISPPFRFRRPRPLRLAGRSILPLLHGLCLTFFLFNYLYACYVGAMCIAYGACRFKIYKIIKYIQKIQKFVWCP